MRPGKMELNPPNIYVDKDLTLCELDWNPREIVAEFERVLHNLNRKLNVRKFSLEGITIIFMPLEELRIEYAKGLEHGHPFGDGFESKIHAYSSRSTAHAHEIGIGVEKTTARSDAFEFLCHEFGHTLGSSDLNSFLEELKAYAFEIIAVSEWKNLDYYLIDAEFNESFHSRVSARLAYLVEHGIDPMQIIANLTREKFGIYEPNKRIKIINQTLHSRLRLTED